MSDELRKDKDTEVEAHTRRGVQDEPREDETEDEVEAHLPRKGLPRKGLPRKG